jgi:hypothetical protein
MIHRQKIIYTHNDKPTIPSTLQNLGGGEDGSLFYDAFSITRQCSIDDRMIRE